jgi:hypothetical protein
MFCGKLEDSLPFGKETLGAGRYDRAYLFLLRGFKRTL